MILADKIVYLRKKAGYSQEQLASEMNVSRQSISKWEGALSIPDMDKVIMLSNIFNVSTDFLLKDKIEELEGVNLSQANSLVNISLDESLGFVDVNKLFAKKVALAVSLFITSPIGLILLSSLNEFNKISEKISDVVGITLLLLFISIGILLILSTISSISEYKYLETNEISLAYGVKGIIEKSRKEFSKTGYINIGIGILVCLFSVVPVIVLDEMFIGSDSIAASILILAVAIGVNIIVKTMIVFGGYDKLLQVNDYTKESKQASKIIDTIAGPYWLIVVAMYLFLSFTSNQWYQTWIIWPIAGIIFGVIAALISSIYKYN